MTVPRGQAVEWWDGRRWVSAVVFRDKHGGTDPWRRVTIDVQRAGGTSKRVSVAAKNLRLGRNG